MVVGSPVLTFPLLGYKNLELLGKNRLNTADFLQFATGWRNEHCPPPSFQLPLTLEAIAEL